MRIKKTRILSMLMTMVLLSSNMLPIYAEASAGDDVTYCYNNDFNKEEDFSSQISDYADCIQVIDEETQNGYVKLGYKKQNKAATFDACLTNNTVAKSMFIELDLSAPVDEGLANGIIRIVGNTESKTGDYSNLIYFGGDGVYWTSSDRNNKRNRIAEISSNEFAKIGLLLNVDSNNCLQNVDVYEYEYDGTNNVWKYADTNEINKEYTQFTGIRLYAQTASSEADAQKEVWFDNLKAYYVTSVTSVNSTPYSLQATVKETTEALAQSTTENVVVKLLDDIVSEETITINNGVTLDLNGYTLTASSSFSVFNGGNVVDDSNGKTGVLTVDSTKCAFSTTNSQMPVYDTQKGGYMFAGIEEKVKNNTELGSDVFDLIFRPSFDINNTLLADGGEAARVKVIIRLEWTKDGAPMDPVDLVYTDGDVQAVYAGDNTAFYIKASGIQSVDDLKITPMVVSDLGVEWSYSSFSNFKVTE